MNEAARLRCAVCGAGRCLEVGGGAGAGAGEIATFMSAHSKHGRLAMELRLAIPAITG